MDTKLKNNNQGRIFGILLGLILIALITTAVISSYPLILKNSFLVQEKEETLWGTLAKERDEHYKEQFIKFLNRSNNVLFFNSRHKDGVISQPSDVLLSKDLTRLDPEDENYDEQYIMIDQFNEEVTDWTMDFFYQSSDDYQTLDYYAINHVSGDIETNSIDHLDRLLSDEASDMEIKSDYSFYVVFDYLEDGSLQIPDYKGLTQNAIDQYRLNELNRSEFVKQYDTMYTQSIKDNIENPSNITIVYASKSDRFYWPVNTMSYMPSSYEIFSEAGFLYSFLIAIASVGLLALILPIKKSWRIGDSPFGRMPFEISITGVIIVAASYLWLTAMAHETLTGYIVANPLFTVLSEKTIKVLDYIVNFASWMVVLSVLYACLLSLRQVFTLGLKRYFKERTIFGIVLVWFVRLVRKIMRSLGDVNLTDRSNKAIMKVLGVNFIILLIMMSVWVFGIPILFLYTIILFFILRKYLDDIKKKYAILLSATSRIADGSLEGTIEEDLGVFEPLKGELTKVQKGFKKAVEEEVKSQRLKTDLITNVSHDLKTPLTAIITYVNLLKDDNITEEERASYIDTLDKKSQRLKRLIEDLFEVSKASSNNITINKVEVNIVNLIEQVLLELDDKIKESNVEFRFNPPEDKVLLNLDSDKTYRVFENLIINITKYAMPHSRAYIDILVEKSSVEIILKNASASELGFNLNLISERFVRGDESRNTEGSGLGLAIVKSFVELQGGKFSIQTDGDLFKAIVEFPV